MNRLNLSLTGTAVLLASVSALRAQTAWNSAPADNLWLNAANWTPADVPDTNLETAQFAASSIQAVSVGAATTVKRINFALDAGDYTFSGSPLTVDVAQAGTATGTLVQTLGAGTVTFNQLMNCSDAGGGNDSSLQMLLAAGSTVNLRGGMATVSNRNLSATGDGTVNIYASATTGTAQFQQAGNSTMNFFVNPTATNQIRSFSNTGGGVRISANVTRALGLGVTGVTAHVGRIFLAANGVTTSGALNATGATIAGPHTLDGTFGIDIPGTGGATHSGTMGFGTLTGTAANTGTTWTLRLDAAADDTLTMSGVASGFPTGYATPVIRKQGPGTVIMSGANTHTVPMDTAEGKLVLTTAQTSAVPMTVQGGATLGVNVAAAGATLNFASLNLNSGSSVTPAVLELNAGTFGNPANPVVNGGTLTVNGATTLRVSGALTAAPGVPFPLMSYASIGGSPGFAGLTLALPFRAVGALVNDTLNSRILLDLTSLGGVTWRGSVDGNWDVDSVGDGSTGTANWLAGSGPNTYVQGAPVGTDTVIFDDTATGTTTVNLTTVLTPVAITVNNPTKNYEWTGTGNISGNTGIVKTGSGTLTLANTGSSTNTGGSAISGGTLILGNGTAGAGSLGGAVSVSGTGVLRMNRPDGTAIGALSGDGTLDLASGQLTVAGGAFTGPITGAGNLRTTATLALTGSPTNSFTGTTTVSAGQLQLNRPGQTAITGDILLTGTGALALQVADQIADTASITHLGTSTDCIPTQTAAEVVKDVTVNSSTGGATGGQMILRNGFTVTGTGTLTSGILGVASAHTATVNAINITSAPGQAGLLRIAGSAGASTLNIGSGGITASGGEIQVKFNVNNQDATVNLGGDFTATGNVNVTNAGYTGANLNVINLTADRTFTIVTGTVTSVAPDLGGSGGLTKTGGGALVLTPACSAAHAGATAVNNGALVVNGTITTSPVTVGNGGALAGDGSIQSAVTVQNGGTISAGSTTAGTLTLGAGLTLDSGSTFQADITGQTTHDRLAVTGAIAAAGKVKLVLTGYTPVLGDSFDLANATTTTGSPSFDFSAAPLSSGLAWDTSTFTTDGVVKVITGGSAYDSWATAKGLTAVNNAKDADPEGDGVVNGLEFYLDGNPLAGDVPGLTPGNSGANFRLTYKRRDDAEDLNVTPETSSNLSAASWSALVNGVNGVVITIAENGTAPDDVEILIPSSEAHRFVRLRLTLP